MSICVVQTRPGIGDMCVFLPYIHLIAKEKKEKVTKTLDIHQVLLYTI